MTMAITEARAREFHEIERLLPYTWPWVLVDRVVEWTWGKEIVCCKAVSAGDPLVAAHFKRGRRILPGVLLIEFVAQSAYLLHQLSTDGSSDGEPTHYLARCRAAFLEPAYVGDVLIGRVTLQSSVRGAVVHSGTVTANDRKICTVELISAPTIAGRRGEASS
jgi:3-hydroxyacyl-[acyl-carrier-protein] dehydratase